MQTKPDDNWDDLIMLSEPVTYHKLSLPTSSIHLIDTPSKFESFLETGLQVRLAARNLHQKH